MGAVRKLKRKKQRKEPELKLFGYDSKPIGICVGIPLHPEGDVLVLWEAGRFCE